MPRHQVVTLYGARGVVVSSYLVQKRSPGFYFILFLGLASPNSLSLGFYI